MLNADDARRASEAGARFAVSLATSDGASLQGLGLPCCRVCNVWQRTALADGFSFLKLFPAEAGWHPAAQGVASRLGSSFAPRGHARPRPQLPGFAQCALRGWLVVDACRRHAPAAGAYHPDGTRHTRFARASLRARWGLPPVPAHLHAAPSSRLGRCPSAAGECARCAGMDHPGPLPLACAQHAKDLSPSRLLFGEPGHCLPRSTPAALGLPPAAALAPSGL